MPPPRPAASAQHKYHEVFIHSGGLGTLKAWLEPYSDGSLPNVRIRLAVLKLCKVRARAAARCVCVCSSSACCVLQAPGVHRSAQAHHSTSRSCLVS